MKTTPRSKAAMVDLTDVESESVVEPVQSENHHRRATLGTAPGQAMQNMVLREKIAEWDGASPVRPIDPKTIVRSKWANRHEASFSDAEFVYLKADIESAGGNVQPIKVRRVAMEGEKYEVVFGHRRHQACLELGIPVLAMIGDVTDQELFVEMDRENRQRKDLRPYEQGMIYKKALDEGLFPSARRLADSLSVDLGNLGKALALARLPSEILSAFVNPLDLQYRWAADITKALVANPDLVLATAKLLQAESPRPSAKVVFEKLVNARTPTLPPAVKRSSFELIGSSGQVGTIQVDAAKNVISLNIKNIDPKRVDEFKVLITEFLK
jgi:ParB family chromosome partitioning protein